MRSIIKNKKGQILDNPILAFTTLIFGLLIVGIVILKLMNSIQVPLANSFGNVSNGGEVAKNNFNSVMLTAITFWDKVMVFMFILGIILLFISAFLVDAHPIFLILYIIMNFLLVIFAVPMLDAIDNIYTSSSFTTELAQLTFLNWLRLNFSMVIIGVMFIGGIIIFGKSYLFGGGGMRK